VQGRVPGGAQPVLWKRGDLLGEFDRRLQGLAGRGEPVHQPDRQCLFGRYAAAELEEFQGAIVLSRTARDTRPLRVTAGIVSTTIRTEFGG
jgi:hypothetical protein